MYAIRSYYGVLLLFEPLAVRGSAFFIIFTRVKSLRMKQTVIIVAGGSGMRMGGDLPKQFLNICGRPVLFYTFETFMGYNAEIEFVLVLPESHIPLWAGLVSKHDFGVPHKVVAGGRTRFHSVKNGLAAIGNEGLVAIHDGVRPFVSVDTIERTFAAADLSGAAIPVLPVIESLP